MKPLPAHALVLCVCDYESRVRKKVCLENSQGHQWPVATQISKPPNPYSPESRLVSRAFSFCGEACPGAGDVTLAGEATDAAAAALPAPFSVVLVGAVVSSYTLFGTARAAPALVGRLATFAAGSTNAWRGLLGGDEGVTSSRVGATPPLFFMISCLEGHGWVHETQMNACQWEKICKHRPRAQV